MIKKKQEISLLFGETILSLKAEKDVEHFDVSYAVPLFYRDQVPFLFELKEVDSSKLSGYKILDDKHPPNKIIKFRISSLRKDEQVHLHFKYYVFVKNRDYEELPKKIKITSTKKIPEEIRQWLLPSKSIQSDNLLIKIRAKTLGLSKDFLKIGKKISISICFHRPILQSIRRFIESKQNLSNIFFGKRYWTGLSDALSGLLLGGHCAAQINLGLAYLRANGIPSRGLIVTTMFYMGEDYKKRGGWLDAQHYSFECYNKECGWVNGIPGAFPIDTNHGIVLRINYLEDENLAGDGFSYYGGIQPWFWISDNNIKLISPGALFKKKKIRKSGEIYIRGWVESNIELDSILTDRILDILKKNCILYENFFGKKYEEKLQNLALFQKEAIKSFKNSDIDNFIVNIDKVYLLLSKTKK